ncbi:MAG: hypothetical protein HY317_05635 [Acidobacteria bacterium]|nr:hypothetical protein [Acidobacteriota bacterium]
MAAEREAGTDALFAELLRAGESATGIAGFLAGHDLDDAAMVALLRKPVPVRFLERVASAPPWSDRPRVLGVLVLNPRTPRTLALRLLPGLYWHDLAEVAASPRVPSAIRVRAEALLQDMLPELRLGERIALGRMATPVVLRLLLEDAEPMVVRAALDNPRLREEDLLLVLRRDTVPPGLALLREIAGSRRWLACYAVRLALVLQRRTPLPIALAQLTSLVGRDLLRIAQTPDLIPLLQAAAVRVAQERGGGDRGPAA